ncbi:hypothetical protein B5X24_HaOG213664 [Helicoverpa armigera]|uniref:Uncharacterized protein n=1 Tax=Helicoverpa armigera TaxID=29058 RepID=A0A2W1B8X7_HELAM|nr:hypothetical protein B5X24_HaOG213664 [Helicoverpa armigera]
MYFKLLTVLVLYLSLAESNDIRIGHTTYRSKKIYSEIKEANPALWTRTDDIIINAPHNEVIDAIYITDLRENKDGKASIVSGGVGMKSVTITLKSPAILRGYKFEIEVYSDNPSQGYYKDSHYFGADTQYARKH